MSIVAALWTAAGSTIQSITCSESLYLVDKVTEAGAIALTPGLSLALPDPPSSPVPGEAASMGDISGLPCSLMIVRLNQWRSEDVD